MTHVPSPPPTLPVKMGSRYFRLEAQEALWAAICRSRAVALYVPPALKDVKLDLIWTK
ncbi:MAG: uncharacterized protein K0R61_5494 [Microvirga sp.]|nr:uncharacterized protein [Microvirga sp.]